MEKIKWIYGYLSKISHATTRIRNEEPDFLDTPDLEYDWSRSVYGELQQVIPPNVPESLGKYVTLSHFVDAIKTLFEWHAKKQATVEIATYGSDFVSIDDLRIQVRDKVYMFDMSVVNSLMQGRKRHTLLSFHQVRDAMTSSVMLWGDAFASGVISLAFIPDAIKPDDIVTKKWGYNQVKNKLKVLLFWKGNNEDIGNDG